LRRLVGSQRLDEIGQLGVINSNSLLAGQHVFHREATGTPPPEMMYLPIPKDAVSRTTFGNGRTIFLPDRRLAARTFSSSAVHEKEAVALKAPKVIKR
jgi:hypothetical protein